MMVLYFFPKNLLPVKYNSISYVTNRYIKFLCPLFLIVDGVVSTMMFMAKETDMSVQSLVVVVSSGSILHIENMHLPAVCIAAKENKGTMLSLLQKLQVQKYSFPAPDGLRCAAVATEGPTVNAPTLAVLAFIDTNHNLCSAHLTLSNSGDGNMTNTLDSRLCSDMCLIHGADDQAYVLAIFNDECLVLIRLADGTLLGELKLLNKANRIVSKAASVAGDSGLLSSVILLTNENSMVTTEATATCQTYWLVCDSLSAKMMFIGSAVLQNGVKYGSVVRDSGLFGNTSALAASDTQEAVLLQCTTVVQTTITCLLDVSLAATTASPTTALEVVRKVVLDSFAARTEVAYVDTEQYLGYLSLATNATDAVGILHQLLQVAHPPEGFLRRLLHASEV